jgi:hypothetical protein
MPDLTDHSLASGKLIEVNLLAVLRSSLLIELGCEDSAATRPNRQASLRCLGMFRRNIGLVRMPFHDACSIDASSEKPGKCGAPESRGDRPHPAADGGSQSFGIGGHDRQNEASREHAQPKPR